MPRKLIADDMLEVIELLRQPIREEACKHLNTTVQHKENSYLVICRKCGASLGIAKSTMTKQV